MAELKKVLILSYFFPPCNLTAAQRVRGWAEYLHQHGYYPIIITRNWDHPVNGPDDMHHDSGSAIVHEQNERYAAYYLPFRGNLRDRLYAKYGKDRFNLLRKALSFVELCGHHFSSRFIPFSNLYRFANDYLRRHPDIRQVVVSGNPFEIFRFGYVLHRKHGVSWIADYRDDWNTSEVNASRGMLDGFLQKLEVRSEKKYMATAACVTSISKVYADKIGAFNQRPGHVILNGYFPSDYAAFLHRDLYAEFTVVYNGMLYASQQIEVFLDGFKAFVDAHPQERKQIRLQFPGILFLKDVAARVAAYMQGYEDVLVMTPRVPRDTVLDIQARAHVLLMVSHEGAKGIPSSKIYEYLGLGKPVLICPGDACILEDTFRPYNLGFVAQTAAEAQAVLEARFALYAQGQGTGEAPDWRYIEQFTRDTQAGVLAKLLDHYDGNLAH